MRVGLRFIAYWRPKASLGQGRPPHHLSIAEATSWLILGEAALPKPAVTGRAFKDV